jgi:hypothetical protein
VRAASFCSGLASPDAPLARSSQPWPHSRRRQLQSHLWSGSTPHRRPRALPPTPAPACAPFRRPRSENNSRRSPLPIAMPPRQQRPNLPDPRTPPDCQLGARRPKHETSTTKPFTSRRRRAKRAVNDGKGFVQERSAAEPESGTRRFYICRLFPVAAADNALDPSSRTVPPK